MHYLFRPQVTRGSKRVRPFTFTMCSYEKHSLISLISSSLALLSLLTFRSLSYGFQRVLLVCSKDIQGRAVQFPVSETQNCKRKYSSRLVSKTCQRLKCYSML